ncbi:MAG: ABC transporter permease [Blastocatellia bacterium]|nr:ABC transporter permease [Blastocatellia bacterium]MBN8724330.1 ABC transporter permease [Acidobacteriota bacterium]
MNLIEANKLAFDAIWANKLRSFLTLLGVIFGVATVIIVVSLIEGFNKYIDEKIADIGTNAFRIQRFSIDDFSSVKSYEDALRRNKRISMEDLDALRELKGSIKQVGAKVYNQAEVKHEANSLYEVLVTGVTANLIDIDRIDVAQGRYFTQSEEGRGQYVCFIGADVASKLFPTTNPLEQSIKVDGRPFRVIGIAKTLGSVFGQSRDKFVSIPLTTFMNIYGSRRSILISVTSTTESNYQAAIDEARVAMRIRRKLSPNEPDNFGVLTPSAVNNLREKIFGTIQVAAVGVTSIALVVGGIVIMNIMLVSVTERTREIGIRKSLGARRVDIMKQFLAESTILSLFGGAIGVLIAYTLSKLVSTFTPIPTSLPLFAIFTALVVSGGIGIISGAYPAWRAAKLDPIVALRAE